MGVAINGAFSQLPAGSTKAGCLSLAQFGKPHITEYNKIKRESNQ